MSERVTWLLCAAVALAVIDGTLVHLDTRDEAARAPATGALVAFDPAAIAKVTIARGNRSVVLARTGVVPQPNQPAWTIPTARNYPARTSKVDAALARIAGWRRGRVAGEKANHDAFQVTPGKALAIKLEDFADHVVGELFMGGLTGLDPEQARQNGGNVDPKSVGRYLRVGGEDAVFVIDDFVVSELEPEVRDWLETPLLGGDGEIGRVRGVSLRVQGNVVPILLEGPYPRIEGGESRPVEPDVAWALAQELVRAYAQDVAAPAEDTKLGLAPAKLQADVVYADGTSGRLLLGDAATIGSAEVLYARVEGRPAPVLVPRAAVATLASFSLDQLNLVHVVGQHAMERATKVTFTERDRAVVFAKGRDGWETTGEGGKTTKIQGPPEEARQKAFAAVSKLGFVGSGPVAAIVNPTFTVVIEYPGQKIELRFDEGHWIWRSGLPWNLQGRGSEVDELLAAMRALAGS